MSNNTSNTPNGVGDKKELKVKRDIPEEEINKDIENWAAERDEKGNVIPETAGKTIAVVFGNPYFKDNVATKEQEDEGSSGATDGTTVMSDQGKKSLEEVKEGMYIQTKSPEQSKESDKKKSTKSTKETKEKDDEPSRD